MRLHVPFLQLPLLFNAPALADEIAALGEDPWKPHPQGFPGNSMLPLIAVDGDPANEGFAGPMKPVAALTRCPYLVQVMASLGVVLGRSRLMRLSGRSEVTLHVDQGYYWSERVRVHVPIQTQPTVRFECGDAAINMAAGECWIFDTWRPHRVFNDAEASRIHLVVDTVGGDGFWSLVARGRAHEGTPGAGWLPRRVERDGSTPTLALESSNVPSVMSPWELNSHLTMLFADVYPNPKMGPVQQLASQLVRTWRSLWAQFGDAPAGRDQFRAVMDRFLGEVRQPGETLLLRNDVRWYAALVVRLQNSVVNSASAMDDYGPTDLA